MDLTKNYNIVPNGARTSSSMNDALEEMFYNMQSLNESASLLNSNVTRFISRTLLQQQALTNTINTTLVSQTLNAMSTILLSAYDLTDNTQYIMDEASTVKLWREYGMITPEITSTPANQFTVADKDGVRWVPKTTRLQYAVGVGMTEDPDLGNNDWVDETDSTKIQAAFDENCGTAWFADLSELGNNGIDIWIKATLPSEYLYQTTANTVVIHPEPMFGAKLLGAWYNTDTEMPLPWEDYIPEDGRPCMNEMFILPSTRISNVKFHFFLPAGIGTVDIRAMYISHIGVYNTQFEESGELMLKLNELVTPSLRLSASGHQVNYQQTDRENQPIPIANVNNNTLSITLNRNSFTETPDIVHDIVCAVTTV